MAAASAVLAEMESGESPVLAAGWAGTALRFDGIDDYALVRDFQVGWRAGRLPAPILACPGRA